MLNGIMENAGPIVVSLLLAGLVALIIVCPMAGSCHKHS